VATCLLDQTEPLSNQATKTHILALFGSEGVGNLRPPNRKPMNRERQARVSNIYAFESVANKIMFFSGEPCQEQVKGHQSDYFLTLTPKLATRAYLESEQSRFGSHYYSYFHYVIKSTACFCWPVWLGRSLRPNRAFCWGDVAYRAKPSN